MPLIRRSTLLDRFQACRVALAGASAARLRAPGQQKSRQHQCLPLKAAWISYPLWYAGAVLKKSGDRQMPAREIRVEQVMNPEVLTVTPGTTIMDALRQMAEKHVGSIVVMKNKKLMGIFTERDLLYKVVLAGKNPEQTPVSEVMTRNVVSIAPDRSVEWAMNKMAHGNFRHLLVADNGDEIYGIISIKDVAQALRLQLIAGRRPSEEQD